MQVRREKQEDEEEGEEEEVGWWRSWSARGARKHSYFQLVGLRSQKRDLGYGLRIWNRIFMFGRSSLVVKKGEALQKVAGSMPT